MQLIKIYISFVIFSSDSDSFSPLKPSEESVERVRDPGETIIPEAGTEKQQIELREVIPKRLLEQAVIENYLQKFKHKVMYCKFFFLQSCIQFCCCIKQKAVKFKKNKPCIIWTYFKNGCRRFDHIILCFDGRDWCILLSQGLCK